MHEPGARQTLRVACPKQSKTDNTFHQVVELVANPMSWEMAGICI